MILTQLWHQWFLVKRPSISLGLFRLVVAFTVAAVVIPSFLHMEDNYLATAFKTQNYAFFPVPILQLVGASPDWVVWAFTGLFYVSLAAFTVGLFSQLSCILMTVSCYYFYALNPYHIGTLSWDILLVTLFLMCVTGYHGDFLSLDALRRGKKGAYKRLRPFFLQRLLQLQLVETFWHTALHKISAGGNWLTDNPYLYLMHYPAGGVVRDFPLRGWLGQHPDLCYGLGVALIVFEFLLPVAWFIPRLRVAAIGLAIAFQVMLWVTLHVPATFLFLFPPMMLLFIPPEHVVGWIERRQARHGERGRGLVLYDGRCGFCLSSIKQLRLLDVFGWADPLDFHRMPDLSKVHPQLTAERCRSEIVLLEPNGRLSGGFESFRRLCRHLPLLWWLLPLVYLPGALWVGTRAYRWVADHRYLLHRNPTCETNQCALPGAGNGASATPAGNGSSNT